MFGHQRGGLRVEQVAVLDRSHAAADGPADRLRRVGMGHHIGARGARLLDDRGHLLDRVLRAVERIARRGDTAAGHHLDVVSAIAQFLAHRTPHFTDTVGNAAEQPGRAAGDAAHAEATLEVRRTHVAMAARLGDGPAGDEHPRADEVAAFDGLHQARIGPPGVAHRREAAHQHRFQDVLRLRRHQRLRRQREAKEIRHRRGRVDVGVDQPGQQRAPAEIDGAPAGAGRRAVADGADAIAIDRHRGPGTDAAGGAVEQMGVVQYQGRGHTAASG